MTLLIVLDLNGTILDSTHKKRQGVVPDAKARYKSVYFRPGMREFLDWLFAQPGIDVGIWTSNIGDNARAVVDQAFTSSQKEALKFILSREHCELGPNHTSFKRAGTLWQRGYLPENVLIIDDSPEKMVPQGAPYYHQIPEFEASPISVATDCELEALRNFIETRVGANP